MLSWQAQKKTADAAAIAHRHLEARAGVGVRLDKRHELPNHNCTCQERADTERSIEREHAYFQFVFSPVDTSLSVNNTATAVVDLFIILVMKIKEDSLLRQSTVYTTVWAAVAPSVTYASFNFGLLKVPGVYRGVRVKFCYMSRLLIM